ncbi:MAG: hypothetical protein CMN57_02795 [Gammaproteobacteria bacterium]|nr:hypothetical protein [Gammaproteobacteria bacterium]
MNILHIRSRSEVEPLERLEHLPTEGLVWLDFVREENPAWAEEVRRLTGFPIHEGHQRDSLNTEHPSYSDSTSDYEMVVFRSLAPESDRDQSFTSRASAFFVFERVLVSVRPADSRSIQAVRGRLLNRQGRVPLRPVGLMHLILSNMVDRFLSMREPLTVQLEDWRRDLLDPNHPFDDWLALMNYRSRLRQLELLCEGQEDAITVWRDNTDIEIDDHLAVRYNDLLEHIRRVMKFATDQQNEVEALVQLHFSAVAHRTNEIVRVLTVISAIFLPLTVIVGVFGMNFEYMPELAWRYSYFVVLGGMAALAIGLLVLFRVKKWI